MPRTRKFLLIASLATIAGCGGDSPTEPKTVVAHDPILFVHGYGRDSTDWNFMIAQFKAAGWTDAELHSFTYGALDANAKIASQIQAKVDAIFNTTTAAKVDIIAHSMGSLSSRYYIRNLGGSAKVDAWVSLAGPNHGTATAEDCGLPPCLDMWRGSQFLTALNADDETPGAVRYGTWWSPADQTIIPTSSVSLVGATNTQTAAIAHLALVSNATVFSQVRSFIAP